MATVVQTPKRVITVGLLWLKKANRYPIIPIAILLAVVLMALLAPVMAPHPYDQISLKDKLLPPSWMEGGQASYLLGTDALGRDILSRIIYGSRIVFEVVLTSVILAGIVGTALGIFAGYAGGWWDAIIMRAADIWLSFPTILVGMLLAIATGPSAVNVAIVIILLSWARFARNVRGEVLSCKHDAFVVYAQVAGTSKWRIMLRHIFPNVLNTVMVILSLTAGASILLEATLSFVGAGIPPPQPSWGGMTAAGRDYIASAWWVSFFPGLAIALVVLSFNMFGDWLRKALDPKLRQV